MQNYRFTKLLHSYIDFYYKRLNIILYYFIQSRYIAYIKLVCQKMRKVKVFEKWGRVK